MWQRTNLTNYCKTVKMYAKEHPSSSFPVMLYLGGTPSVRVPKLSCDMDVITPLFSTICLQQLSCTSHHQNQLCRVELNSLTHIASAYMVVVADLWMRKSNFSGLSPRYTHCHLVYWRRCTFDYHAHTCMLQVCMFCQSEAGTTWLRKRNWHTHFVL